MFKFIFGFMSGIVFLISAVLFGAVGAVMANEAIREPKKPETSRTAFSG